MEKLSYFYGKEAEQFAFFTVPKILFKDPEYKNLPCEAKMLYGMMLDRMSLSIENQWFDEKRRAFIRISEEFVTENLGCGRNKALNLMKLLEDYGLIERRKLGQGKSSIIYVKRFIRQSNAAATNSEEKQAADIPDTEQTAARNSEVYFSNNKKFRNQTTGSLETKQQEVYISNPNKTDMNNTDIGNPQSHHIVSGESTAENGQPMGCDCDANEKMRGYSACIRENIDIDGLKIAYPYDRELIEGIYDLILETVMCENDRILIASSTYPTELVRSRFLKLNYDHVTYVLDCLKSSTSKVKNIKKYLLAMLFNAVSTMDGYYRVEVNHDASQFVG